MEKHHIVEINQSWQLAKLSIEDNFWVEWESIYVIRADSQVNPVKQCKIRAKNLALVMTISLLRLNELISELSDR